MKFTRSAAAQLQSQKKRASGLQMESPPPICLAPSSSLATIPPLFGSFPIPGTYPCVWEVLDKPAGGGVLTVPTGTSKRLSEDGGWRMPGQFALISDGVGVSSRGTPECWSQITPHWSLTHPLFFFFGTNHFLKHTFRFKLKGINDRLGIVDLDYLDFFGCV